MNKTNWRYAVSIIIFLLLTGCWNRREIEKLNFVMAAGIDRTEQGFLLSSQVANINLLSKQQTEGKGAYLTYTSTGKTFFDAIRNTTHHSPKKLFWAHTEVIVIGRSTAEKGITPVLEYLSRDAETRRNFLLAVTPLRAEEIIKAKIESEKIPAIALSEQLELYTATSTSTIINVNEFLKEYTTTKSLLLPVVKLTKDQGGKIGFSISGSAVFKKDKFISFLSPIETRGVLWVNDKVESGIIVAPCPNKASDENISFEILRSSSDVKVQRKKGEYRFDVHITEEGNLAGASCIPDMTDPKMISKLEKIKEEKIKSEIISSIKQAQRLKTDVFGFGELVHRTYPKEWKEIKKNWETLFPKIKVHVQVDSRIFGTALKLEK